MHTNTQTYTQRHTDSNIQTYRHTRTHTDMDTQNSIFLTITRSGQCLKNNTQGLRSLHTHLHTTHRYKHTHTCVYTCTHTHTFRSTLGIRAETGPFLPRPGPSAPNTSKTCMCVNTHSKGRISSGTNMYLRIGAKGALETPFCSPFCLQRSAHAQNSGMGPRVSYPPIPCMALVICLPAQDQGGPVMGCTPVSRRWREQMPIKRSSGRIEEELP